MAREYTVDWASPPSEPFPNPHGGELVGYTIKLAGESQSNNVRLMQKPDTPAPFKGQVLYGDVEVKDKKDGSGTWLKFVKAKRPDDQPRGNRSNGYREDPQRQQRIVRQHSQTAAISALEVAIGLGIQERPESFEEFLKLLRRTADYMDRDVEDAVASRALSLEDAARQSEDSW